MTIFDHILNDIIEVGIIVSQPIPPILHTILFLISVIIIFLELPEFEPQDLTSRSQELYKEEGYLSELFTEVVGSSCNSLIPTSNALRYIVIDLMGDCSWIML